MSGGLVKQKQYDWKDSNMALFGSEDDKKVKKESAETEKAWNCVTSINGQKATFVWRIEKFKVVPWPKEDYGEFYSGDSYIVYNQRPDPENPDSIVQDIHFWIGQYSTQDEYGTAAYKTVELDTLLDDAPIQHREVQGHESDLFKSYFSHLTILKGGSPTGFRHVTPEEYKPRLLHFHGRRGKIIVQEVALLKASLDSTDVFILDGGLNVYQWNGEKCNKDEKFKAVQYLQDLKSQRHGKSKTECLDEEDVNDNHEFYGFLEDREPDDDDDVGGFRKNFEDQQNDFEPVLFSSNKKGQAKDDLIKTLGLSDKSGKMSFTEVTKGEVTKKNFDSSDVFILDNAKECFVWIGKNASRDERKNGLTYAHNYLNGTEHALISVTVVSEGKETRGFKNCLA